MEGLCMALKRLCYPCRCSDMILRFAKPVTVLSMITKTVVDFIYNMDGHHIMQWNTELLVGSSKAGTVRSCGCREGSSMIALDNCCGFIDGTVRPICRPEDNTYKGLSAMVTKEYTQSSSSLSLNHLE